MITKRLIGIFIGAGLLLLVPAIAMLFTSEVNWKLGDFLIAAILLFGTGILIEVILRTIHKPKLKLILITTVIILLVLFWMELAVGIFGTPFAGS